MEELKAFQALEKKWQENELQNYDLFNELFNKTDKSSEAHKKIWALVDEVDNLVNRFNQDTDKKALIWDNYIANKTDVSQTFESAKKVNEKDFDAAVKRLEWQLNTLVKNFDGNFDQLKWDLGQLLNVDTFINSLTPSTLAVLPFSWKFKANETPDIQVTKKWAGSDNFADWVSALKKWARSRQIETALWNAG